MRKVIIPTDFSDNAYNAVRYAVSLFKEVDCTFYLVHTYTPAIYQSDYMLDSPGQFGLATLLQEQALERLKELRTKLENEFKNPRHQFVPHAAFNLLVDELRDMVEKENADLIIMGTKGATGAKEILLGTHAVHVIKKTNCPIIVVPPQFEYENPKEILFPTDYEIDYGEERFAQLLAIADDHISRFEVIHVSSGYDLTDKQLRNKAKLDELLGRRAHLFHEMPSQNVVAAINNFQLKNRINLLAMVRNKHTFFERLFLEPIIKKVGFHVTVPFMVIP
ncbi:universal stress protein [Flavobacteriaceae bacterium TP-CH-4]|uniref:Universal stress protein n=1 Tax=Pelagihabitans pacificus TaxID=2696054 RepID=A0A967AP73_9FLAO|nr:universal stress protein [Pelagihabitans pacificus]NHF57729.1 universal stress protein [Pelagihabitans pacificus]